MIETAQLADEIVSLAERAKVEKRYWFMYASDLYVKAGFQETALFCRKRYYQDLFERLIKPRPPGRSRWRSLAANPTERLFASLETTWGLSATIVLTVLDRVSESSSISTKSK